MFHSNDLGTGVSVVFFFAAVTAPPAHAQLETDGALSIDVKIMQPSYMGCDDSIYDFDDALCINLDPSLPHGGQAFVWILLFRSGGFDDGVGSVEFGVYHSLLPPPGEDQPTWTSCTGGDESPTPGWPAPGSGNAVTWSGFCYPAATDVARIGFLTVGDGNSGCLDIVPDPRVGHGLFTNCDQDVYRFRPICLYGHRDLSESDDVCNTCGVGDPGGLCGAVPGSDVTWTSIKSMF